MTWSGAMAKYSQRPQFKLESHTQVDGYTWGLTLGQTFLYMTETPYPVQMIGYIVGEYQLENNEQVASFSKDLCLHKSCTFRDSVTCGLRGGCGGAGLRGPCDTSH